MEGAEQGILRGRWWSAGLAGVGVFVSMAGLIFVWIPGCKVQ